jgi:hypothetical protein
MDDNKKVEVEHKDMHHMDNHKEVEVVDNNDLVCMDKD